VLETAAFETYFPPSSEQSFLSSSKLRPIGNDIESSKSARCHVIAFDFDTDTLRQPFSLPDCNSDREYILYRDSAGIQVNNSI
jgi:hypothetical protein